MAKLYDLDRWVLAHAQRFAHWTQRKVGISATHWCQLWAALSVLAFLVRDLPFTWYMAVCVAATAVPPFWRNRPTSQGVIWWNPVSATARLIRLLGCMFLLPLWDIQMSDYWWECATVCYIFHDCCDLPAAPSELRQRVGRMVRSMRLPARLTGATGGVS